jgi:hypothetical protein
MPGTSIRRSAFASRGWFAVALMAVRIVVAVYILIRSGISIPS